LKEGMIMDIKPEKYSGDAMYPTKDAIRKSMKTGLRGTALFAAAMMTVGLAGCFSDENDSNSDRPGGFWDKFKWTTTSDPYATPYLSGTQVYTEPTLAGGVDLPQSSESRSGRLVIPTITTSDVAEPGVVFFTEPTTPGVVIPTEETALAGDVIDTSPTLAGSIMETYPTYAGLVAMPTESFPALTSPVPTDEPILSGEIYLP